MGKKKNILETWWLPAVGLCYLSPLRAHSGLQTASYSYINMQSSILVTLVPASLSDVSQRILCPLFLPIGFIGLSCNLHFPLTHFDRVPRWIAFLPQLWMSFESSQSLFLQYISPSEQSLKLQRCYILAPGCNILVLHLFICLKVLVGKIW